MKKVIKMKLDPDDIGRAIKELKDYQDSLMNKVSDFIDALVAEGFNVAKARLASTRGDSTDAVVDSFFITDTGELKKAIIVLDGDDCLFIEFGAGIMYNTGQQHPLAGEFGYGPGTYPSEHPPNRAINPGRWIYGHNDDGTPLWSIGTEASMPIFGAAEHMRKIISTKAREIFRS